MRYTAAVITVSDSGARGERADASGPALCALLERDGWEVVRRAIVPDDEDLIGAELVRCSGEIGAALVLTTGGTGFAPRDVTPEATRTVIEREAPGIAEAMRASSMRITPRGCLSRGVAGIRGRTLIVNLPGSERAAVDNIAAVIGAVRHGVEMLLSSGPAECASKERARIIAVCVSERKGERKHPVERVELVPNVGIPGDAHAGDHHRQVSLLGAESVAHVRERVSIDLGPGDFAENILAEGIRFHELPVGARLRVGSALCEVTQIGKECHAECEIKRLSGDCVMPREGVFVRVLERGAASAGDEIELL